MPRDKLGNELTWKEYYSRFKEGVETISPLQQTSIQLRSTLIMVIGLIAGIIISAINYKTIWWLLIILIGGLFNTLIQLAGLWQKKNILKRIEKEVGENAQ